MLKRVVVIGLVSLLLIGGMSCGKAPGKPAIPETITPAKEIGKTPDNAVPLGTPLRMGTQEVTVLEVEIEEVPLYLRHVSRPKLIVELKLTALENTEFYARDFAIVGSKGIVYEKLTRTFGGYLSKRLIAGTSIIEKLEFDISKDDGPNFYLVWLTSVITPRNERFFELGISREAWEVALAIPEVTGVYIETPEAKGRVEVVNHSYDFIGGWFEVTVKNISSESIWAFKGVVTLYAPEATPSKIEKTFSYDVGSFNVGLEFGEIKTFKLIFRDPREILDKVRSYEVKIVKVESHLLK